MGVWVWELVQQFGGCAWLSRGELSPVGADRRTCAAKRYVSHYQNRTPSLCSTIRILSVMRWAVLLALALS